MNLKKYLKRIKYFNKPLPDVETLKKLHIHHLYNVPFENLDIHYNKKIILELNHLYEKIVENKRGGFCYELNGLFYFLLKETGFKADMISARVKNKEGGFGKEFDHLAIIVHLEEDWLVDVGFGDSFIEPLKFKLNFEQKDIHRSFMIIEHDEKYFRLIKCEKNGNEDLYIFSLNPHSLNDFDKMCLYHQTSPKSSFTQKKICSMATPEGRITLSNLNLIKTTNGNKEEIQLKNEKEFREKLLECFNINLMS